MKFNAENVVGLKGFVEECDTFEDALEVINIEGEKLGAMFKKGNIHYFPSGSIRDRRIICSKKHRNKLKKDHLINQDTQKQSFDRVSNLQATIQIPGVL